MTAKRYFKTHKPTSNRYFGSVTVAEKTKRMASRKSGPVSTQDRAVVEAMVIANPGELSQQQIAATASMIKRRTSTVARLIDDVRERLARNATRYADIHLLAAEKALDLADSDPKALETARRAAEFALQHISVRDDDGAQVRVIERESEAQSTNVPSVKIGIALGGMRAPNTRDAIDADYKE